MSAGIVGPSPDVWQRQFQTYKGANVPNLKSIRFSNWFLIDIDLLLSGALAALSPLPSVHRPYRPVAQRPGVIRPPTHTHNKATLVVSGVCAQSCCSYSQTLPHCKDTWHAFPALSHTHTFQSNFSVKQNSLMKNHNIYLTPIQQHFISNRQAW